MSTRKKEFVIDGLFKENSKNNLERKIANEIVEGQVIMRTANERVKFLADIDEYQLSDFELDRMADEAVNGIISRAEIMTAINNLINFKSECYVMVCDDGRKVQVLKKPSRAFELYVEHSKWDTSGNVKLPGVFEVTAGAKKEKEITQLFNGMNEINGTIQQAYNAAYLAFTRFPCDKEEDKQLKEITKKIIAASFVIQAIVNSLKAAGSDPIALQNTIDRAYEKLEKLSERFAD
jgi:hypothetical protein